MSMLKSMILSLGLAAGVAISAQAQSVATLPPNGGLPAQTAKTPPFQSTQSFYPRPGGSEVLKEEPYQPPAGYATSRAGQPNSNPVPYNAGVGPKPN
jgi:hypothetical protein